MRVAIITSLFPPIQTGTAFWAQEAARALVSRGHTVIVVTGGPPEKGETVEMLGDVRVYRLPWTFHIPARNLVLRFDQFHLLLSRRNLRRLRDILLAERSEMIHQVGHLLDTTLLSVRAKHDVAIPAVCSISTRIGHPTSPVYDALLRSADRFILGPLVMKKFERLMALDDTLARHYERVYGVRGIARVPVCVSDDILDLPAAAPPPEPPARVISVGHVSDMRDRRALLLAMAELKRRGLPVCLDVIGKILTGTTARLVAELGLADTVTLHGEVPRAELFQLLRASSLEVHWIDVPGVGLAAMEAMALGLPVAAWAYEGIYGDVPLRHLENVVFIDPRDQASLVRTLEILVRDEPLRRRIGAAARELVRGHLTWSSVAVRLEAVYAEATS